jgi:iron complex transport system substrate-binding protein
LLAVAIVGAVMPVRAVVQAIDDTGVTVTLAAPARRIVSLAPHATELLVAAGAGARIVGAVDAMRRRPAAQSRNVGNARSLDLERIVALSPISSSPGPTRYPRTFRRSPRAARECSSPTPPPSTVSPPTSSASARSRARNRTRVRWRLHSATGCSGCRPVIRRAAGSRLLPDLGCAAVPVGGRHLVSEAMRLCGGENVFAALTLPAPSIGVEAVLAARPEVIIAGGDRGVRPAWLDDWKRWPSVPAVADGSLYAVDADLLHRPGPRFVDGVEELCLALDSARGNRSKAR